MLYITINGILYDTIRFKGSKTIDFANHKVNDEIRGYICHNGSNHVFQYQRPNLNYYSKIIRIALILESPHKDEFDIYYNPLHPANGLTGKKININIANKLRNKILLQQNYCYEIFLINPIQYQCSMYHELEIADFGANIYMGKCNRKITNQVFSALFFGRKLNNNLQPLRQDFINRLKNYNPDYIFNCCTFQKKRVVETAIRDSKVFNKNSYFKLKHPSVW